MRLVVDGITFGYESRKWIVRNLSFEVEAPSIVQIVGPNGVGKSTLLKLLAGYLLPGKGSICLEFAPGKLVKSEKDAYVEYILIYPGLVSAPVELPVRAFINWFGVIRGIDVDLDDICKYAELEGNVLDLPLGKLSEGMRQRVILTLFMLDKKARIMLLDEPFASVDDKWRIRIAELIYRWVYDSNCKERICFIAHTVPERSFANTRIIKLE